MSNWLQVTKQQLWKGRNLQKGVLNSGSTFCPCSILLWLGLAKLFANSLQPKWNVGSTTSYSGHKKEPHQTTLGQKVQILPEKNLPWKVDSLLRGAACTHGRCTPCRGRLRSYAKPKNASQLGSQTIFVPEFNRQRIRQSGWNSSSLDKNHYW